MKAKLLLAGLISLCFAPLLAPRLLQRDQPQKALDPIGKPQQVIPRLTGTSSGSMIGSTEAPAKIFAWSQLESEDLAKYIVRLRAAGCPESTIRDIITGIVNRNFQPRFAALRRRMSPPFWQTLERRTQDEEHHTANQEEARRELERERTKLVRELLGMDLDEYLAGPSSKPDGITRLLDAMSEEVRPQARRILQSYDQLESAVIDRCSGTLGLPEQIDLERLYNKKLEEMRRLLSPQELEDFELTTSPLAHRLRSADLVGFSPTEREFREIFRIVKEVEGTGEALNPQQPAQASERLRDALGAERFADYQRSQDLTYRRLVEFASQYGLGTEVAAQIHDMREAVIQQADALQGQLPPEGSVREKALSQIQAEAMKAVRNAFGDEAYSKYLTTQLGRWVELIPTWTNGVVFRD